MATMKCPRCGSEKIMPNLQIRDRSESLFDEDLEVVVDSKPNAVFFKGTHYEPLRATVCGECGYVSLSVKNPIGLWKTYLQRNVDKD